MNHENPLGIPREEGCLFHRGVAATHDDQVFVTKVRQRAVTGGTSRYSIAAKTVGRLGLAGNAKPLSGRPGSNDQRFRLDHLVFGVESKRPLLQVDVRNPLFQKLSPKSLRLFAELDHQVRALNTLGKAR